MKKSVVVSLAVLALVLGLDQRLSAQALEVPAGSPAAASGPSIDCGGTTGAGPFNECCGGDNPAIIFNAGALFLKRTTGRSFVLNAISPTQNFNVQDLTFDFEPAVRVSAIGDLGDGWGVEGVFFGLDNWRAHSNQVGGLVFGPYPGFVVIGSGTNFDYAANLFNSELNFRYAVNDRLSLLAGFRWIELSETFKADVPLPLGGSFSQYHISANNHLYGGQLGVEGTLWRAGGFHIDGFGKAGLFANPARQTITTESLLFPVSSLSASNSTLAFAGELALNASYDVTRWLTIQAGYEVFWLTGIALAPNQLTVNNLATNQAGINTNGSIFYHGAYAGLQIRW